LLIICAFEAVIDLVNLIDLVLWPNRTMIDQRDVMFSSPDSVLPQFSIKVRDVGRYLDTETLTVKNKTLDEVVEEYMTNVSESRLFTPIRQNQILVGGNPG
jgi:hypothetical protein